MKIRECVLRNVVFIKCKQGHTEEFFSQRRVVLKLSSSICTEPGMSAALTLNGIENKSKEGCWLRKLLNLSLNSLRNMASFVAYSSRDEQLDSARS